MTPRQWDILWIVLGLIGGAVAIGLCFANLPPAAGAPCRLGTITGQPCNHAIVEDSSP